MCYTMVKWCEEAEVFVYSEGQPLNTHTQKADGICCKKIIYFLLKGWAVLMNPINFVNYPSLLKCSTFSGLPLSYTQTSIKLCLRNNILYVFGNLDVFKEALFYQTILLCVKMFNHVHIKCLGSFKHFKNYMYKYMCVSKNIFATEG